MNHRIRLARARRFGPACAAALALLAVSHAAAQAPKPSPKAQPKSPVAAPPSPQQPLPSAPQTVFSPWTKFCDKAAGTDKRVCFISQYGQSETGGSAVVATLIEPEGGRKALWLTLPLGVQLKQGMRATVDQGQPIEARYAVCRSNGCTAEIEASAELIQKLRGGKGLAVQGVDTEGYELSYSLPLESFAKAYDGAPVTPEELEQQRKLQADLMRRAAEARKRTEGQPPASK